MARGDRDWALMADDYETDDEFRKAIVEELAGLENMGHRIGGAFVATPLRLKQPATHGLQGLPDEEYRVIGWHFKQVFMPAVRVPEPQEESEPSPVVAEPVAELVTT
jgi:hypothetical protein